MKRDSRLPKATEGHSQGNIISFGEFLNPYHCERSIAIDALSPADARLRKPRFF